MALTQVKTAGIAADAVTGAKIADDAVNSEHYVDGSIDNAHVADDQINSEHYAAASIDHEHLANDCVDGDNLADNACDSEHYTDGSIDHVHLAGDAVDGDNIADDSINSEHYVDASIDHQHLANDCVDGDNLADNACDSEHYTDGSIDHVHLANDCVDADNIDDNAVGLAAMAHATDGVIITFDANGAPAYVGPGSDGQVLTSTGAGSPPAFEDAAGGLSLANDSNNRVITGTGSGLNGEANLTFDGSTLQVDGDIQGEGNDGTANNLKWDKSDDTLYFRDSVLASFGTGGDLDIYHNGSNSYINNATGALAITGDDLNFENAARNETYAEMNNGGAVKLYYDNVKKFETTSAGVKAANICKAWCNYDGRDNSIRASFNISSVTDNETGTYTFNWSVATGVDFGFAGAAGEWLISGTDRRVLSYRHGSNTDDYGDDSYLKVRTFGLNTNQTADSKVVTIAAYSN
tara:strand:- start:387 stop:1778 length:1392 start_codon:yes stop_codon:yes gene_type:complete